MREYQGKPGRNASEREKARTQRFFPFTQQNAIEAAHHELALAPVLQEQAETQIILEEPLDSPLHLSWLLVQDRTSLGPREQQMLAFILQDEGISRAYSLAQAFVTMIRKRQGEQFDTWLQSCLDSDIPDIQTFAEGLQKEYLPVKAALTFPYSNGPVEGQINKLKYMKRSMYGRGSFELVRQRFLHAA